MVVNSTNVSLVALLALGALTAWTVTRMEARTGPIDEPITLEGTLKVTPDYSTPICHLLEIPTRPPTTVQVTTTISTTCRPQETTESCETRHLAKVANFIENITPCPPE